MHFGAVKAIVFRQFYLLRESPARIIPLFAWVTVDILLWGFMTKYLAGLIPPTFSLVSTLLGAVLLWDFFTRIMHGVATAFLEDLWSRNFLNIFASPLTITEYLTGLVVTSVATSFVGLIVMLLVATSVFGLTYVVYGAFIFAFLFILFAFGIALGIFGSAIVLRYGPAAEWFVWPIPAFLSPFIGVFYPLTTLPEWMQIVSKCLPPAYVFEGMRAIAAGKTIPLELFTIGLLLSLFYIFLACRFFVLIHRQAVASGLLARYSAESVG